MNPDLITTLGDELYDALTACRVVDPLTTRHPEITVEDAYRIQQRLNARRVAAGETIIGKKIGVTSKAVMDMLGVYQPDFGLLTDGMVYNEGQAIPASTLIQPKAEGEIAFILGRDLVGPGVSAAEVIAATEGVMACFEIVDSRIRDWKIRIQDTVPTTPRAASSCSGTAWCRRSMSTSTPVAWCSRRTARSSPPAPVPRRSARRRMRWPGWRTRSAHSASRSRPAR